MKEILPVKIGVLEMRTKLILDLKKAGWSITDISHIFSMDKSYVCRIIKRKDNK